MNFSRITCIVDLIQSNALQQPSAPALISIDQTPISYSQLAQKIQIVVELLNRMGIGQNDVVALSIPNGVVNVAAFLATTCGAIAAPINPAYRLAELTQVLAILRPKAVIIGEEPENELYQAARQLDIPIITLLDAHSPKQIFTMVGTAPDHDCQVYESKIKAESTAAVVTTSGTTASPKFVPLTHRNLITSARNLSNALKLTRDSRLLNINSLCYTQGIITVLSAMMTGGSTVCTSGFNAPEFLNWLKKFQPTWYSAVSTVQQGILERVQANPDSISRHSLQIIRSTAIALPQNVREGLENAFRVPVADVYGSTEAGQISMTPIEPGWHKPGTNGLSLGQEIAVIDSRGSFLPPCQTGEIVVRGESVTGGYLFMPKGTENPFFAGWFRTGDLGSIDEDGYITLSGRIKEMINRGGEKISPAEVDQALLSHPNVARAAAFGVHHPRLGEEVAAAVVLSQPGVTEKELRDFVTEKLADFKIPRRIFFVKELPTTFTGKIQRTRLAELFTVQWEQKSSQAPMVADSQKLLEKRLSKIWSELLRVPDITVNQTFTSLGGDSLLAARLAARIRTLYQVKIGMVELMEADTIAAQANLIQNKILDQIDQSPDDR
jgi:acyl-CoA synthetase (AMP-forming)/AMP-acid ligase II/acyl carrier protein